MIKCSNNFSFISPIFTRQLLLITVDKHLLPESLQSVDNVKETYIVELQSNQKV